MVKPRLRGVSHQYAFYVALAAGAALVVLARGGEARVAALVYGLSLAAMFGASALYHRIDWSPRPHAWLRRLVKKTARTFGLAERPRKRSW